jgi:iron-sulfur cluster repair protein YtfE (RIC family)
MSRLIHARVTEPLREEHRHLFPHVDQLAVAGDAVGRASADEVQAGVEEAYGFLTGHLIPHATVEDEALYPEVDRLIGARGGTRATDTMRRDHVEVVRLTERLGELREPLHRGVADENELRRVLYGLYALVSLHFAKEEEVYLPLLDRELTAAEALILFERMEDAGRAAGVGHVH